MRFNLQDITKLSPLVRSGLILCSLLLLVSCGSDGEEENESGSIERVEVRPEVVFGISDAEPLQVYIVSQGIVEAEREQVVSPRVSGYVDQTIVRDGQFVRAGDTLLSFREEDFLLDLQEAEINLSVARSEYNLEYAPREQIEGITQQNIEIMRMTSGLTGAEHAYERAQKDFEDVVVTAPFTGYLSVSERPVEGGYIGAGTELARLLDDTTVQVRFDVLEAEVNVLERGMAVIITSPTGIQMRGQIESISPRVDPDSKTGSVRVTVPNPDRILKTGMTVGGRINIETYRGGTRIPRIAVLERDGGRQLFFKLNRDENNNPIVDWIYIYPEDLIAITPEYAMISSELLAPGDTIAVDRHNTLQHLQPIEPVMEGSIFMEEADLQ